MIVKIIIDGEEYEVLEGENILSICQKLGIFVPHLCYLSKLSPSGRCGLCVVEVDDKALALSCLLVAKSNLKITTFNNRIQEVRKKHIDKLIKNHNILCHSCSKNGWCGLQTMASEVYRQEKGVNNIEGKKYSKITPKKINDNIIYDGSKCVFCNRCVKFLNEICGEHIKSPADLEGVLNNDLLGNVIDICPTAALNQVSFDKRNSLLDAEETETFDISNVFTPKIKVHMNNGLIAKISMDQHWISDDLRFVFNSLGLIQLSTELYSTTVRNVANKINEQNNEKCVFLIGDNVDLVSFFYVKYLQEHDQNVVISFDDHNVPTDIMSASNLEDLLLSDYLIIVASDAISDQINLLSNIDSLKDKFIIELKNLERFFEINKDNKVFLYSRPAIVLYQNAFEQDPDVFKRVERFAALYEEVYNFPLKIFVMPGNISDIYRKFITNYVPASEIFERYNKHDLRFILQIGDTKSIVPKKEILYISNSVFNDNENCVHIPALHFLEDSALYLNIFGNMIKTKGKSSRRAVANRYFLFDIMQFVLGKDFYDINEEILDEIRKLK